MTSAPSEAGPRSLTSRLVAESPAMVPVVESISKAAESDAPVLLEGEQGVGKEFVARLIHLSSYRKGNAFETLLPPALPADMAAEEFRDRSPWLIIQRGQAKTVHSVLAFAIVIGSEHAGLSVPWRKVPGVAIPMHGSSDSLNAATAAALLLYEARRQRR